MMQIVGLVRFTSASRCSSNDFVARSTKCVTRRRGCDPRTFRGAWPSPLSTLSLSLGDAIRHCRDYQPSVHQLKVCFLGLHVDFVSPLAFGTRMSSLEAEFPSGRVPSHTVRNGVSSPLPSISLSRDHIDEALAKSPDNGATLDLAHKGITDVGESGAEELANIGQEDGAESSVIR